MKVTLFFLFMFVGVFGALFFVQGEVEAQQQWFRNNFKNISGVEVVEVTPCANSDSAEVACSVVKAILDPDLPKISLDDNLQPVNVAFIIRERFDLQDRTRWIMFDAGGVGEGYASTFGRVAPGEYQAGINYGDDLIRWHNDAGAITVDVLWTCDNKCTTDLQEWLPNNFPESATGWFANTGGAGYAGIGSRERAVIRWIRRQAGGNNISIHAHSSGSGKTAIAMTRYDAADFIDNVVFDGGPVLSYTPWYCAVNKDKDGNFIEMPGPLGPLDIENFDLQGGKRYYDFARDNNNGLPDGDGVYDYCQNSVWDEANMLSDSSFTEATDRVFEQTDVGVILGGSDTSSAPAHARLWFGGYDYEPLGTSIPALDAQRLEIVQGYCAPNSGDTYQYKNHNVSCAHWDASNFPTADSVTYDSSLANATHSTTESFEGATVAFNMMLDFLNQ